MQLQATGGGAWEMVEMREMEFHLLSSIGPSANVSGDERATRRLFPTGAISGEEREGDDWKELVVPDLERAFRNAIEVVNGDLAAVEQSEREGEVFFRVKVSAEHTEHWYSALNQARLVLAEKFGLPASEEEFLSESAVVDERWLAGAQSYLYAVIQTFLLESVMGV
ncbi:MAG: DUF2017 family protein [Verrucomicrobiota bacterium]